jgi:hypothetical protein
VESQTSSNNAEDFEERPIQMMSQDDLSDKSMTISMMQPQVGKGDSTSQTNNEINNMQIVPYAFSKERFQENLRKKLDDVESKRSSVQLKTSLNDSAQEIQEAAFNTPTVPRMNKATKNQLENKNVTKQPKLPDDDEPQIQKTESKQMQMKGDAVTQLQQPEILKKDIEVVQSKKSQETQQPGISSPAQAPAKLKINNRAPAKLKINNRLMFQGAIKVPEQDSWVEVDKADIQAAPSIHFGKLKKQVGTLRGSINGGRCVRYIKLPISTTKARITHYWKGELKNGSCPEFDKLTWKTSTRNVELDNIEQQ